MADNWADLLDGSIDEPFAIDDSFTSYRTGSLEDGSISTKTCRNWTDNNAFDYGTLGSPQLNDSNWMQSSSTSHCANYLPILCLCMQTNENVADQYTVGGSVTGNTGDVVLSLNSGDQTITIAEGF
ncbi:MAG: hypothetical protein IPJ69_00025 [Deltaproteobacteria bacterium]|nr:MAG: hypothetical protein IPJ69_00025 [Deltaproteobacteria bacterium]